MLVRVIDYRINDGRDDGRDNPTVYRLFTALTDPDQASAAELAAAYAQRWEIESGVLGGSPEYLPHGRTQAGDRHLNFHETRDNLRLMAAARPRPDLHRPGG